MTTKFLVLLFAHLLADYPLQGDFLASQKGKRLIMMITHCGIWTGCISVAAHLCGTVLGLPTIAVLFFVHFIADEVKAQGWYCNADPLGWPLWLDQTIHVGQIIGVIVSYR